MSTVKRGIEIAAPIEKVWDTLMDPGRLADWVTIHKSVGEVSDSPLRRGSTMRQAMHVRGFTFHVNWTVVALDKPRHAEWKGTGPAHSQARIRYELTSLDDNRTRFEYTNEFHPPGGRLGESSPAVTNGVVYVGSDDHHLYAFDVQTGTQLWAAPTNGAIGSSPVVANGVVYISSADAHVYAFDVQTGTQLWAASTGGPMHSSPVVANGVVYAGSDDGSLYAYTLRTSSQLKAPARPSLGSLHPDLRLHVSV